MAGLILLMLSMYPQFAADQQALNDMLELYPEQLKKAFGMNTLDFGSLIGFYAVEVYMIATLAGSVYAALLASSILAKEEGDKTIEFLLSKPITRSQIVMQKLLAVAVNLIVFNVAIAGASLIGFSFSDEPLDRPSFALLLLGAFLLHASIASIAFLLSAVMRKSRSIVSIALGIVFASYALHLVSGISEQAKLLRHISLFHYVDAAELIASGHIDGVYAVIIVCLITICIGFAWMYYNRKDIAV